MRRYKVGPAVPVPDRAIGAQEGVERGKGRPGARLGLNLYLHVY